MKTSEAICKSLGLKQEEIAALLRITRSQWSMFESGKRILPLHAMQMLTEMLSHAQTSETSAKVAGESEKILYLEEIKLLLRENEYQILVTERKISALEKKQSATVQRFRVSDFITKANTDKNAARAIFPIAVPSVVSHPDLDQQIIRLKLKHELLENEKSFLNSKIFDLTKVSVK